MTWGDWSDTWDNQVGTPAGYASATGTANTPTTWTATWDDWSATYSNPVGGVSANAGVASATATMYAAAYSVLSIDAPASSATGTALGPGSPAAQMAIAGVAEGTATANGVGQTQTVNARPSAAFGAAFAHDAQGPIPSVTPSTLIFDVYSAANPNGPLLATLTEAFDKAVTISLRGVGAGTFSIARSSSQATSAVIAQGNLVKVRLADLSPAPIAAFWMETGRFDLVASAEAGAEVLTFGGKGALAYLNRAILWSESFLPGEADPVDNEWQLYNGLDGSRAGAILHRLVSESIAPTRPQQPLPSLSMDFSGSADSTGANWSTTPGSSTFVARVGDYLDAVVGNLLGATSEMVIQMDPYLGLHAYNTLGVDRTSATFAPGKVRMEKAVNIASQLTRELSGDRTKTHILAAGDPGYFGSAASTVTPVREGFASSSGTDVAGLAALATSQISIRQGGAESIRLGVPYGTSTGLYRPGPAGVGDYWVGDTITVHTGTGNLDYNESAQRIAEITVGEDEAGTPIVIVALGSSYSSSDFSSIHEAIAEVRTDLSQATNEALRYAQSRIHPRVVDVLPTLPDPSFPIGSQVFLTTDEKLYLNRDNTEWTVRVAAADITGQIVSTQISDDAISSPQILAGSITAGDILAGTITGAEIAADAIQAGHIEAGAISAEALAAEIVLASKLLTASSGRRVEMDSAGIRNYSGSEELLVNIPTVGSEPVSVKGAIEASSLISTATAELRGATTLTGGSVTELQVGVTNPTAAPVLAASTPSAAIAWLPYPGHGLCYDPNGYTGVDTYWIGANPTTGTLLDLAYEVRVYDGAVLRTIRKTGTTTTGTGTIGVTSHVSDTAQAQSGATASQVATPLTMPRAGTITKVSAYLAGYGGAADCRLAVWNTSGNSLGETGTFSAAGRSFVNGNSDKYEYALSSPVALAAGTTFWAGFLHTSSGDGFQWDRDDGAGKTTKLGDGLQGDMTSIATSSGHKPNVYVTYTYTVDASVEGNVGRIIGVARAGAYVWVLDVNGKLYQYDQATLAYVGTYDHSARVTGVKSNAGLFYDGSQLVITTATSTGSNAQVRFVRISTSGAYISTLDATGLTINAATQATRGGWHDGNGYWIAVTGHGVAPFLSTTGAYVAEHVFGLAGEIDGGVAHTGSQFIGWSPTNPTRIWQFTNWDWTTGGTAWSVVYTWYDSVGTTHETSVSPRGTTTVGRRRQLTISTPAIPGGASEPPDKVRVYLTQSSSPALADYDLQVTDALTVRTLTSATSGAAPPGSNGFPAGNAAIIRSATTGWELRGDGTIRLPYLVQSGSLTTSHNASRLSAANPVTFAVAYSSPPQVTFGCGNYNYAVGLADASPTTTGFTVYTNRIDDVTPTANVPVFWIAVGPP